MGRVSRSGDNPLCLECGSLERHRIFRQMLTAIRSHRFEGFRCLHIAPDRVVSADWFADYEPSYYGATNSLDLEDIDREDRSYDLVICNHVLEHVPDDTKALRELFRIVSPEGLIFLSVPSPTTREVTEDWGFADPERHEHYRIYGADFGQQLKSTLKRSSTLRVEGRDFVTGMTDVAFLVCRRRSVAEEILRDLNPAALL